MNTHEDYDTCHKEKIHNLFNIFPVGMMIFEKITTDTNNDLELRYINETALTIFRKGNANSEEEIKKTLKKFNKLKTFSTLNEVYSDINDESEENLFKRIFEDLDQTQTEMCERYISKDIMIYVKIKIHKEYKLVTLENYNDERLAIQNNIIKNIKTQYLLTLSHELNNPLNSLTHSVNEIISANEATKEKKALINGMKIHIRLVKVFIKNFIFSVKMSFDMSTLKSVDESHNKRKEDCLSLEYVFRKIIEKCSLFFKSKKIKLDCDFNPMGNTYVTYDYNYFKTMIKNIFMYLFYRTERKGAIKIELEFQKELKITFKKDSKRNIQKHSNKKIIKNINNMDTTFVSELNIESSIKTLNIIKDIINKLAKMCAVSIQIIEDESPCYLIIYLKYELDDDASQVVEEIAEEFTCRNSKNVNTKLLEKSIIHFYESESKNHKCESVLTKKILNKKIDFVSEQSLNLSSDSWNVSCIGHGTDKLKKNNFAGENLSENNLNISPCRKSVTSQFRKTFEKHLTVEPKLKESSKINSEYNSEIEKISESHLKPNTMLMPSITFNLTSGLNFDNKLDSKGNLVSDIASRHSGNSLSNFRENIRESNEHFDINKPIRNFTHEINNNLNIINKKPTKNNEQSSNDMESFHKSSSNSFSSKRSSQKDSSSISKQNEYEISPLTRPHTKMFLKNQKEYNVHELFNQILPVRSKSSSDARANNILVVDDDKFNIIVLQSMLKKLNLQCDTCMNGLDCLNKLQSKYERGIKYKLILMDVMMPIMDGIEASTQIEGLINAKKLNSDISIVIISAHNIKEIIDRANKLSIVKDYLFKPVKNGDIQRIISKHYN